jgi:hypothetical protein
MRSWADMQIMRVASRCSVSIAELRHRHTIGDLLDYVEWLEFEDDCAQQAAEEAEQ